MNGDYHLRAGSPAINAAADAVAPETDRDGVVRPQHGQADVGAYEFHFVDVNDQNFLPLVTR